MYKVVATAVGQNSFGSCLNSNMHLTISMIALFFLSTTPFLLGSISSCQQMLNSVVFKEICITKILLTFIKQSLDFIATLFLHKCLKHLECITCFRSLLEKINPSLFAKIINKGDKILVVTVRCTSTMHNL